MRYAYIIFIVAASFLCAGILQAEDSMDKVIMSNEVDVDRNNDGQIDGKDVYDDDGKVIKKGYDLNGDGIMDRWESYDPNTGLPEVAASDAAGELQ